MPVRSLPTWPEDKPFEHLPTIETLRDRSGLKIAKLRELLREVTKWRCKDNSVRYDEAAAAAALEGMGAEEEETTASATASLLEQPLPVDPTQAALAIMQRTLSLLGTVVRERGEIVKLQNDTIRTMGDPQKLGLELVRENMALMRGRLEQHDAHELKVLELLAELNEGKSDRERQAVLDAQQAERNKELMGMLREFGPKAVEKLSLVGEAHLAVSLLDKLDLELLEQLAPELLPDKADQEKVPQLVAMMRARRAAAAKAAQTREAKANGASTVNTTGEPVPAPGG